MTRRTPHGLEPVYAVRTVTPRKLLPALERTEGMLTRLRDPIQLFSSLPDLVDRVREGYLPDDPNARTVTINAHHMEDPAEWLLSVRAHQRHASATIGGLTPEDLPALHVLERFVAGFQAVVEERHPNTPHDELTLVNTITIDDIGFTPEHLDTLTERMNPDDRLDLGAEALGALTGPLLRARERQPQPPHGVLLEREASPSDALTTLRILAEQARKGRRGLTPEHLPHLRTAIILAVRYANALAGETLRDETHELERAGFNLTT